MSKNLDASEVANITNRIRIGFASNPFFANWSGTHGFVTTWLLVQWQMSAQIILFTDGYYSFAIIIYGNCTVYTYSRLAYTLPTSMNFDFSGSFSTSNVNITGTFMFHVNGETYSVRSAQNYIFTHQSATFIVTVTNANMNNSINIRLMASFCGITTNSTTPGLF